MQSFVKFYNSLACPQTTRPVSLIVVDLVPLACFTGVYENIYV